MRRSLLLGTCGAALLAVTPFFSSAGEAMMHKLANEVSRLTGIGETGPAEREETEFGRHLLQTWKNAGVKLPMPEEQISRMRKGVKKLSTKPEVELPSNMRFTGFLQYSNVDGKIRLPYGFYTFSQKDGLHRKLYKKLESCINGGGAYIGNRLRGSSSIEVPMGNDPDYNWRYYEWDTDTWQLIDEPKTNKSDLVLADVCLDPTSDKVYGISYGEGGKTMLVTVDYDNFTCYEVGDLFPTCGSISAFAINNDGTGYVLDQNSNFFKVNLDSATAEKIGSIDFEFYSALQSMTFDPRTGKLYLVASEGDPDNGEMYGRLCEVNLTDASTKLVGYLPEAEEYTVLHVVYDPEEDAPGTITDLTATYSDASMNGVVTFTIPEVTFGGNAMSGDVNYSVYVNDSETPAVSGTATPGEKVSTDVTATEGRTKYVVVLSNEAGEGERNAIESWGGEDTPATTKAYAKADGDNVTITWEAGGANGGYADFDGITYTLFRFPGPTMVAEGVTDNTYTDNIAEAPNGAFVYNVVPVRDERYFQGIKTTPVYGGSPRTLPYYQDFEDSDADYDFYMLNNHDKGWEMATDWGVEGVMWYTASPYIDGDAWALTPTLAFEEGNTYIIEFKASRIDSTYEEYLSIGVGEGYDTADYETILDKYAVQEISFYGSDLMRLVYECKKTGGYHIGFHALSPRNQSSLVIHEVSVEQGLSVKVPAAVNNVTATSGKNGDLTATINFTTPSTTVGGTELDTISKVTLYREGTKEPIAELTDVLPGKEYSFTDEDAMNGKLTYSVTAWNEFGEGDTASVSVYVGIDLPTAPIEVTVKDNLDGSVTLNWEEDTIGVNGGIIDLDEVSYNIYYYNDGSLKEIASNVEGTSYIVTSLRNNGAQSFLFLFVSAVNDLGESETTEAPVVTLGDPYTVPFMEGFANLEGIWRPEGETVSWGMYSGMSYDGDNFLIGVRADDYNATGALRSGKFTIKDVENPKVVFSFYGIPGIDNTLALSVCSEGGSPEQVLNIPFITLDGPEGWRTCMVDFSKFVDAAYFNLLFEVTINDEDYDFIYIDDINVRDVPEHNLAIAVAPQNRTTAGEEARVDVNVHNVGTSMEQTYKVEIYVNEALHTTLDGITLQSFDRTTLTCKYPVSVLSPETCEVKAQLVEQTDFMTEDNTSEGTIKVATPMLESAYNLTADEAAGTVILNWEAPEDSSVVTDSFEGYESFLYKGFGDWKVYDGDGMNNLSIISNYYPGSGTAAAFFTADFASLGYDVTVNTDFAGHTGESFITCVIPSSIQNNDWAISPELSGNAQTISLFTKSVGAIFGDSFEILYSEGSLNTDDFISTGITCDPNESWKEVTAEIPSGAKYFAIHCNSFYGGMLMIDDVTYEAAARELTGYNIYRNDELIATVDANTLTYSEAAPSGQVSYKVTAIYSVGESAPCEKIITTSVATIGSLGVNMSAKSGIITIEGADGYEVSIVALDGKVLFNGTANGTITLPVTKGLYIVTVGDTSAKLLAD
ncbi:MAG: fibronectin type III domain-containing protein [Bacteroides sp.]|nr:fibronectin type III domain-containing protein [Bacteroides sp.]